MKRFFILGLFIVTAIAGFSQSRALVFQSDFGLKDGAVAAMKGVAYSLSQELAMFDITHEIPAYNIWEGAYRLNQSASYWPAGTVFVSVVDPGVGSARRSVVMKSKTGHYFVTPDNVTLTFVAENLGIAEVRVIDETKNRLRNSNESYTFHGRDVYAYTAARLAAGIIRFEEVGDSAFYEVTRLSYTKPSLSNGVLHGTIDILDIQYGNLWTNIDKKLVAESGIKAGDKLFVKISRNERVVYQGEAIYGNTFSAVAPGKPVAYLNSLLRLSLAINQGNFAEKHKISSGGEWRIQVNK
jgi:S-adenosylmethionine hydrolase